MTADRSEYRRVVCVIVASMVGIAVVSCSSEPQTTTPTSESRSVATTSAQASVPPFETQDAFAWLTAACGSPSAMNGAPNGWMPSTQEVRLCVTPIGQPGVLVGVYDDPAAGAKDLQGIAGQRGYASRQDSEGRTWIFMVDGPDSAPLKPLERYGFVLH